MSEHDSDSDPQATDAYLPAAASTSAPFTPGIILAGRFRIVAQLGKGGMGEVYRADDLTLGQPVALKFLSPQLTHDPDRLTRFRREVAHARHISHPNVCRVFDLVESAGRPFLTMEFIDGEDLAALLRRVGRLPEEKALEVARQLCAALAAVHDQGLLHRDLKPHNVMLDGRGHVRLTDFGLVATAGVVPDVRSGTPGYMAPEQLAGEEVSVRSDLFALGLVLYEVFTGQKAFTAKNSAELAQRYAEDAPSKPSEHVSGLSPAAEEIILRCLKKDPRERPRSASEVLAALPGGDPLAAALAAGQTPSPEMVANAPVEGSLHPAIGLVLLVVVLGAMVAIAFLNEYTSLLRRVPLTTSPEVLAHQARTILHRLGYTEPPGDVVHGLDVDHDMLRYLQERNTTAARWEPLASGQPAVMLFWHRQSPHFLLQGQSPPNPWFGQEPGRVQRNLPPTDQPGMVTVTLDLKGRLIGLQAVPAALPPAQRGPPVPWGPLFEAAGLDFARLAGHETAPRWPPPGYADDWRAWLGVYSEQPTIPMRVEAAAWQGKPVYFRVGPADRASERERKPFASTLGLTVGYSIFVATVIFLTLTLGSWLAWRNWRAGRSNVRGAGRLAGYFFLIYLLSWLVGGHHTWSFTEELFGLFAPMLGRALLYAVVVWLIYVALEPTVRRRWPGAVVSWNRLLEGRFRDPLVARDLLVGLAAAGLSAVFVRLSVLTTLWLEQADRPLLTTSSSPTIGFFCLILVVPTLLYALTLWLLLLVCRREWLALLCWFLIGVFIYPPQTVDFVDWLRTSVNVLVFMVNALLLFRLGLLALAGYVMLGNIPNYAPLTADLSAWYASTGIVYGLLVATLAVFLFLITLGNRPLLPQGWFGED